MIGLGGSQVMIQGAILIFVGTFFIGIAQVITFIAKIELNSRASAEHNRIASKSSIIIVSNTSLTLQAVLEANQTIAPKEELEEASGIPCWICGSDVINGQAWACLECGARYHMEGQVQGCNITEKGHCLHCDASIDQLTEV